MKYPEGFQAGVPLPIGVARICFARGNQGDSSPCDIGLLFFGVRLVKNTEELQNRLRRRIVGQPYIAEPWCFLTDDKGDDLVEAFGNPGLRDNEYVKSQRAQVWLKEDRLTLEATAQAAEICGEEFFVLHVRLISLEDKDGFSN